jgi:large subunit ribosomal protein L1
MNIDKKLIRQALDEAIERSVWKKDEKPDKVRKFDESIDLIINVREIDIKNPNNRIEQEHLLPHAINKEKLSLCFFVNGDLEVPVKNLGYNIINADALDTLQKKPNKDKKSVVKKYDYFIAQSDQMRNVAKVLARFLGQRGKMPKPQPKGYGVISPTEDLTTYIEKIRHMIRIELKKQLLLQLKIGKKSQPKEELMENLESILHLLEAKFPNGLNHIKTMFLKTSMGPAIKVKEAEKKR